MAVLFSNNAASNLSASITSTATSLSVTTGTGAEFPNPGGSDYFYATLSDAAGNIEIIKVTARSTDTLTIVRGQDGTTARAWANSDKIELRLTAAGLGDLKADTLALVNNGLLTITAGAGLTGSGTFYANQAGNTTISLAHSDTSSQASSTNSGATVIQSIGLDDYGHLTSLTTKTIGYADVGAPSTTGTNASGTWGISISGNAATSSSASTASTVTGTQLGASSHGLTAMSTAAAWSQPAGYETMVQASTSSGLPANHGQSYFGYLVTSRRDTGGGYSALLTAYDGTGLWFTYQGVNTAYPTWRKVLSDNNYNSYAPTLTGGGASGTWGISITGSSTSMSSGNAWNRSTTAYGYIDFGPANSSWAHIYSDKSFYFNQELYVNGTQVVKNSGTWGISITGNAAYASSAGNADTLDGLHGDAYMRDDGWNTNPGQDANTQTGMRSDFSYSNNCPWTGDLIRFGSGGYSLQLSSQYQGTGLSFRTRNGDAGTWNAWSTVLHSNNYNSYALPLSGGTVTGNTTVGRDLYISGQTGGSYGNRLIVGNTSTSYTSQDTNLRPTIQAHGQYPVLSLNHTVTSNTNHGPTIQYTCNGTGYQFVHGTNGNGTQFFMGYANASDWNPHNGIAGYQGVSFFEATTDGYIGIGAPGDWGGLGGGHPAYHIHGKGYNVGSHAGVFQNLTQGGVLGANGGGYMFDNTHGNHSWGIVAEFRVSGASGSDRPSILFSNGYNSTTWSVGFGYADDQFRINQNHGHRNGSWGTERLRIDTGGNAVFSQSVTAYSDERLKTNWLPVASNFVDQLATVKSGTYTRIDDNIRQAGSSAQDWQKLLPEVVLEGTDEAKTLSLAYGNAALVSAVELAKRVVAQEARIKRLETIIENLAG